MTWITNGTRAVAALWLGLLLVLGSVAGCEGRTVVPPGAQEVHLTIDGAGIHLAPATVRAGQVYLVIDTPGATPLMIQQLETDTGPPGGLSDERLASVMAGDSYHTMITSGFANGGEPHGNATRLELSPGRHAFTTHEPSGAPFRTGELAILTVTQ